MTTLLLSFLWRLPVGNPWPWREERESGEWKASNSVKQDMIKDRLDKINLHKFVGLYGMQPLVLRELTEVIAEPLSIIF